MAISAYQVFFSTLVPPFFTYRLGGRLG
jgi:hypothetical protein